MRTTQLGQTGLKVSALGLGGMPLSLDGRPERQAAIEVIHHALNKGVTFIDTADSYCLDETDKHHNEKLIAEALASYPKNTDHIIVATKGGLMRHGGDWTRNGDPEHLRKTINESHQALGAHKAIDLWQYHAPDPDFSLDDSLAPVREAVQQGIIRHVGVSNFSVEQIKAARDLIPIVSVQNQYSPWHRAPENDGVLDYCESEGLTFLPWSPFGGRRRHHRLSWQFSILNEIADATQASTYRIVLAWIMAQSPCILPIPGASQISSVEDSLTELELDAADLDALDQKL